MIINKIENANNYLIKVLDNKIDIYNTDDLEKITKRIVKRITKNSKLNNTIILEFYPNNEYGTIVILRNIKNNIYSNNDIEVKITIHTDNPFLYKMDYLDIKDNNMNKQNIYYYKNNFYLEIKKDIKKEEYLNLLELSEIIYEDTFDIINNGIKINI